jgi:ATP-dependent Lon protease
MNQFLIWRIKFLLWQKKKYSNERMKLLGSINNIMNRINECFEKNIINQYYFNTYLSTLEDIHEKYKKICKINLENLSKNRLQINKIRDRLIELSKKTGMMNISSITSLNFCLDVKDLDLPDKNIVEFVDLVFNPFAYSIYDLDQHEKTQANVITKQLSFFNASTTEKNKSINTDWNNLVNLKNIMFTKLSKKNSLVESINGTRIYISIKISGKRYALVIDGYFKNDSLNISRYNGFIFEKQQLLLKQIASLDIIDNFKYGFIEQISIRDMLMFDVNDLIINIKTAYETICEFKKKTISQTVKEFLNKSLEEQRDLITYFLLCDEESELQYFSFLLYDLINNESYLLKAQPLADQIFNSLHWSIQKHFKNTVEQVEEYTKKLMNLGEESFSYEKRICLMRASDSVKAKAMEKLKEINNKNSENCSKAQQYLDSLLKIPFGINRSEDALNMLDEFKCSIDNFIIISINLINEIIDSNKNKNKNKANKLKKIVLFLEKYKKHKWKYDSVHLFIESFCNLIDKVNNLDFEITVYSKNDNDNKTFINLVEAKLDKLLKKDLVELIQQINDHISLNNKNYSQNTLLLKKNGAKKMLVSVVIEFLDNINIDDSSIKFIWDFLKLDINFLNKKNISESHKEDNQNIMMNITDEVIASNKDDKYDKIIDKLNIHFDNVKNDWTLLRKKTAKYISNIDDSLDKSIHGQKEAKKEIKRIIAQWINGESSGYCLGFEGPPGTGKTSLAKYGIANCLKDNDGSSRPFSFIALGGSSNGSTLEGHNYTYVGSTYGKIVDILIESQCMNPIIYIDELDKISNTDNGRELIGILTHLTDSTQNDQFMDKYFSGIPLDLSKVLFIFSYNDYYLLDSILADRIHRVRFDYLKVNEKTHIMSHYLVPNMLTTIGFEKESIKISKEALLFIIKNYTYEAGVRKLKERVLEIIRQINLELIQNVTDKFIENKVVDLEYVEDFFKDKPKIQVKKIGPSPQIGLVNGLFATAAGMGGITIIEAFKTPSDTKLALTITGQQGDVMKESITCAKTIAWNIIPCNIKKKIIKDIKDDKVQPFGIHIHCPEAATPKDGPSAGAAITLAIVSLLTQTPVNNEVAMTGEIDLNGQVHTIGGLDLKIEGGKWAGVKKILVPEGNRQDLDIIKLKNPTILENIDIVIVKTIWEVLEHTLVYSKKKSKIEFSKFNNDC